MARKDETGVIIEENENYETKIIPTKHSEINRKVKVKNNATIEGGIYGKKIEINNQARVKGPLMAKKSVQLRGGKIDSDIGSIEKTEIKEASIIGTVISKRINIKDSIIYGNLIGSRVIIKNSVVLGNIISKKELNLKKTTCFTFKSKEKSEIKNVELILPQAIINGEYELKSNVKIISINKNGKDTYPELGQEDIYKHEGNRYLTLSNRIMDLTKVTKKMNNVYEAIEKLISKDPKEIHSNYSQEKLREKFKK
ncbi:MAG: N-acetylglucosamine-1-phosphate uridyltransferase [Candidatus Methanohalarchaeum thermophilum]|uniref:N-acetylglucosamine-1-phosphate uridyltransferase n=1 Tax=Methanohalarchaeum thermophilum TaxID=1903181 RepID=A0A1Q6DSR3_METT1|nr:MAG: N-acetylglucosamine-1-phosphate uridyltransferase [Candidatus Methanohalarchaeum thermophilum]